MAIEQSLGKIEEHCKSYFAGHALSSHQWHAGPIRDVAPWFRVLQIAPGPRIGLWVYVSVGASALQQEKSGGLEFILVLPNQNPRGIELLAMTAYYHRNHGLGLGHTLPIGEPWLESSACDHLLVSLPYPFGPDLEIVDPGHEHMHMLWLLPITGAERDFKASHGLEALEQQLESQEIEYWDPNRNSAV